MSGSGEEGQARLSLPAGYDAGDVGEMTRAALDGGLSYELEARAATE